jgi:hypothetical protein
MQIIVLSRIEHFFGLLNCSHQSLSILCQSSCSPFSAFCQPDYQFCRKRADKYNIVCIVHAGASRFPCSRLEISISPKGALSIADSHVEKKRNTGKKKTKRCQMGEFKV